MTSRRSPRRSAARRRPSGSAAARRPAASRPGRRPSSTGAGSGRRARPAWASRSGSPGRLPAPLLRGAPGPGRPRRRRSTRRSRRTTPPSIVAAAGRRRRPTPRRGDPDRPFFARADGRRAGEQRPGRARADRVVHRGRRLPGPLPRAPRDDARREVVEEITRSGLRGRGGAGYPTGREVGHGRQAAGRAQVRRLQRRRGRPRRVHGPQRPGERPAPRPGRDGHRRLRGRREPGLHLRPRRVSRWRSSACEVAIKQAKRLGLLGSQHLRVALRLHASTSASAPGRSSAARRRR